MEKQKMKVYLQDLLVSKTTLLGYRVQAVFIYKGISFVNLFLDHRHVKGLDERKVFSVPQSLIDTDYIKAKIQDYGG
jgi:hypothetical protein